MPGFPRRYDPRHPYLQHKTHFSLLEFTLQPICL